ncbi:MAG: hypothetical protein HY293_19170 [Planctomycetes bacterium]|nr:hypothetical protein [Planctomycetota bacterium]
MIFVCECGKKFKAPEGTPPDGHACPRCAGTLRPFGSPPPAVDVNVLIRQKKALRDEMRVRDRQLRIAQAEINRLKAENQKLNDELSRARGGIPVVTLSEAPVVVDRSFDWRPLEMPSERLDLSAVPMLEELPDLSDAPQLPSDRLILP